MEQNEKESDNNVIMNSNNETNSDSDTVNGDDKKISNDTEGVIEINLTPHFLKMKEGQTKKMTVMVRKKDGTGEKEKSGSFNWLSSDKSIVTVKNGKITAKKKGIAVLYIKRNKASSLTSSALIKVGR